MNIYEEARRRILEPSHIEAPIKAVSERSKALACKRVSKYSRTEKGRAANARRCHRYYLKNKGRIREYLKEWLAAFEKEHGMKYATYRYRMKHGLPVVTK